jgi:group I intron endonuclease
VATIHKIYRCINNTNKKVYIGYTIKELEQRAKGHLRAVKKGSDFVFHKSIRKYGFENFTWEVLFESKDKKYILNEMETFFIKENNSFYENGFGYNMTYGGQGGMCGKKHNDTTKEKMKLAWEKRENRSFNLGKKHNDTTKEKMSRAKLGKKKSDEYKLSCSVRNKKRYEDVEHRKKMSEAIKLMWQKRRMAQQLGEQN